MPQGPLPQRSVPRRPVRPAPPLRRPAPAPVKDSHKVWWIILAVVLIGILALVWFGRKDTDTKATQNNPGNSGNSTTPTFNKQTLSTGDPASLWVVVNKPRALNPLDYRPGDLVTPSVPLRVPGNESMKLRQGAATALEQLFAGAKTDGLNLMLSSGFRSYNYQVGLYNGYVKSMGQAAADKTSARPGHSEHQTGLAADVEPASQKCEVDACFADTPEGTWIAANAYKYGFIIRYTKDKVDVTGYDFEPWHLRYVGPELAAELHTQGIKTLEEFFGLPGGPSYP